MSEPEPGAEDLGAVEFLVIEAPAHSAEAADFAPLLDLVNRDVIRVLDLEVVAKDEAGKVSLVDPSLIGVGELSQLAAFAGSSSGLLDGDDVAQAGGVVQPGHLAVVLVYENVWTATLAAALGRHGARLVATGQVQVDDLEAALDDVQV